MLVGLLAHCACAMHLALEPSAAPLTTVDVGGGARVRLRVPDDDAVMEALMAKAHAEALAAGADEYDRIMEARKPPAPKPKPAPPAPPKAESYYYGGSKGYRDTHSRKSNRGKRASSSSRPRSGRSKPRKP